MHHDQQMNEEHGQQQARLSHDRNAATLDARFLASFLVTQEAPSHMI